MNHKPKRIIPSSNAERQAQDEFAPYPLPLLQALHILTRDGRINQDSRRKFKQVKHLIQLILPGIQSLTEQSGAELALADLGAGKGYLGMLLAVQYAQVAAPGLPALHVHHVECRQDLVTATRTLIEQLGLAAMSCHASTIQEAATCLPAKLDVVTALHACDTATDDAIDLALRHQASMIALVPCCQAALAAALRQHKSQQLRNNVWAELWRHPLHTREFGSHTTNVLRVLRLQASGYQVTVTELTGWEHSMKNELILATRARDRDFAAQQAMARERLQALLTELMLPELLRERFRVSAAVAGDGLTG